MAASMCTVDDDLGIVTDAIPISPLSVPPESASPNNEPIVMTEIKENDRLTRPDVIEDEDDENAQQLHFDAASYSYYTARSVDPDDASSQQLPNVQTGHLKVENSAIEVASQSHLHIGHKITNQTDFNVKSASSVIVDNRQFKYVTYTNTTEKDSTRSTSTPLPIIEEVQEFNRHRYLNRLAHVTPLPWCARFSPHLDDIYTNVQLISSNRFDGRPNSLNIPLEQILGEKHGDSDTPLSNQHGNCKDNSGRPCRVLIEGNPGYGKTTLTLRMALDWAAKKNYMKKFHLVFFIQLRHFKGDLQSYICEEFYPQHENQGRDAWWKHIKDNHGRILFILDGLDELPREHRPSIDQLLKGHSLNRASLVVTSRLVSSDDSVLSCFNRRILLRGFSEDQTEQFIHNYFQVINEPQQGSKLKMLLNGPRWCGRHLTSCPLTCLLLCAVFKDEGDRIINKVTEVYRDLVAWLIRQASSSRESSGSSFGAHDYERALRDFGYLCIQAVANGRVNFTADQLQQLPANSGQLVLQLGLLVQSHAFGKTMRNPQNLCYHLIHKTFLEYLAAYYLSHQVEENLTANMDLLQSERFPRESLHLALKFLAGLMGENAATLFRFRYFSDFDLPMVTLFELLHESGATPDNVGAVSSILDDDFVLVQSKRVELDAWARLLSEPDCPIVCLKFLWTSTSAPSTEAESEPLDFSALDRFFTAFQTNTSVVCLAVNAAMGISPNEKEAGAMAAFTAQALKKSQLRYFSLHLIGDTWSTTILNAINRSLNYRIAAPSLVSVNINVDMGDNHIASFCQGLRQSNNIKSLVLSKLSCGPDGYAHIATLLKSIHHLSVSLNLMKSLPPSTPDPLEEGSPQDLSTFAPYFHLAAQQRAGINAKVHPSEDVTPSSSTDDLSLPTSAGSLMSFVEFSQPNGFSLHDGLRFSGFAAPSAIALPGQSVPGCPADGSHNSGFHCLFTALKDPECQLSRLDLTGCCLGPDDFHCLGEALRVTSSLKALRFTKLQSFEEALPIILNTRLSWLDLSSGYISLNDQSVLSLISALSSATQLTTLSLAEWKFTITKPEVIGLVNAYMKTSRLQELCMAYCRIQLSLPRSCFSRNRRKTCPSLASISSSPDLDRPEGLVRFIRSLSVSSISSLSSTSSSSTPSPPSSTSSSISLGALFLHKERPKRRFDLKNLTSSNTSLESKSSKFDSSLRNAEFFPHLSKLSLAATVVSYQIEEDALSYNVTGPELMIYLSGLKTLTELSVSVKPPAIIGGRFQPMAEEINDSLTKKFFSLIQRKLGRTLTQLRMSHCSITWHRPHQTAFYLTRQLQKCEKLVSFDLNFVQFRVAATSSCYSPETATNSSDTAPSEEVNHWLLDAIVSGIPHLEELNLSGMQLSPLQSIALALKIRDRWKGDNLYIHTRELPDNVVLNLIHTLKTQTKFHAEYVGGYRNTVHVRRRTHICGLFRYLRTSSSASEGSGIGDTCEENIELLCASLPPGHRNLFGLTPFDFSIMHAHLWNNKL